MKSPAILRPLIAVVLCIAGFALARITPYREGTVIIDAGGCQMVTDLIDKGNDETSGSVILLHGLSANKKLMAYMARSFAEQNLRVFVPDLPGHGRTPGPFSFSRAETCAESFTRQLIGRHAVDPSRTILAGHSMGGAIAMRLAARIPVAGVIAVSPAPMSTRHGIARYLLPFESTPAAPAKTLVISGSWEPQAIRETALDLTEGNGEATNKYVVIPHATHVSLLFDPRAARASQEWGAAALGFSNAAVPASLLPLMGSLVGFIGILLLAGPFIREALGANALWNPQKAGAKTARGSSEPAGSTARPGLQRHQDAGATTESVPGYLHVVRVVIEMAAASAVAVAVLHFWQPLAVVRLFDGGYFASFLLIVGVLMLAMHYKSEAALLKAKWGGLLAAALAALLLHFLFGVWFDATLTESWLSWSRWSRFPVLLAGCLPYLVAEELLVTANFAKPLARILGALALRGVGWLAMLFAIFVLHQGPILLLLLAPYFGLFCILHLAGMHIVRRQTRSPAGAALFGAILLAGFCLVIFPVT